MSPQSKPQIKALLFDADGVLFFHTDKMFSERIIEEYGADRANVEQFFAEIFPDCQSGIKDVKVELASRLSTWHWPGTVDEVMEYWYVYEHNVDQPLIEYVRDLEAKGLPSYIATNNDHYRAAWCFEHLNLEQTVFRKLYAAGDMGVAKPEHAYLQMILDDLGNVRKDEILFWDDTPKNIVAAQEFGINAERYTTYANFAETMKHYV